MSARTLPELEELLRIIEAGGARLEVREVCQVEGDLRAREWLRRS